MPQTLSSGESSAFAPHTGALPLPPESVRRILVCQLRQIGDVLLATPSIELLARRYPKADIHVFTEKKCLPMLQGNPHIHTIWPVDKKKLPTLLHELAYYRKVTAEGFDLVADFQQLPRCRWVVAFSRARVRLSFLPPWYLRPLYTHWVQPKPAYAGAFKAGMLAPLGIAWQGERPRLHLSEEERTAAHERLTAEGLGGKVFMTVDASHRHLTRRWPAEHYAALMDMIAESVPGMHFLLPYGPGEEEDSRALRARCRHRDRVVVPSAVMSLRHMSACMEKAAMHLGNCSAPRHIAVAVDVPSFTILGATGAGWTFPSPEHTHIRAREFMDLPCQSCNKNVCNQGLRCLVELTPDRVFPRFLAHFEQYAANFPTRS